MARRRRTSAPGASRCRSNVNSSANTSLCLQWWRESGDKAKIGFVLQASACRETHEPGIGEDGTRVRLLVSGFTRTCSLNKYANIGRAQSSLAFYYVGLSFSALRFSVVVSCVHTATFSRCALLQFSNVTTSGVSRGCTVQVIGGCRLLIVSLQHCSHGCIRSDFGASSFLRAVARGCAAFFARLLRVCVLPCCFFLWGVGGGGCSSFALLYLLASSRLLVLACVASWSALGES